MGEREAKFVGVGSPNPLGEETLPLGNQAFPLRLGSVDI